MLTNHENVRLELASPDKHAVLENLLELYSHDLSDVFQIEMGEDGRFGYSSLALYWSSPSTRYPFVIRYGQRIAGFALATRGCPMMADPSALDVSEFFVLRKYRRAGVGRRAAHGLWDELPGRWIVRVLEANRAAVPFWIDVVRQYTRGEYEEVTRSSGGRLWRVLSFDASTATYGV